MHISGESLLNDGSSYVFFIIFSQIYYAQLGFNGYEAISVGRGFLLFFQIALGGAAIGTAFALALVLLLYELDRRLDHECKSAS